MVDLLGKKIWIGNDRQLLKQVEDYAFAQGFGYPKNNGDYLGNGIYKIYTYQKHTEVKKVYSLFFLNSLYENKKVIIINMMGPDHLPISKYHTQKNRFDSIKGWENVYHHKKTKFEELDVKLLIPKSIELW